MTFNLEDEIRFGPPITETDKSNIDSVKSLVDKNSRIFLLIF